MTKVGGGLCRLCKHQHVMRTW